MTEQVQPSAITVTEVQGVLGASPYYLF